MTRPDCSTPSVEHIDTRCLEDMMGYNVRRASLVIMGHFMRCMTPYALGPVDFSLLALIADNPGITSRQVCSTLGILPPNLVSLVNTLEKRTLIDRRRHPSDGRAVGLHITPSGQTLLRDAQRTARTLENEATTRLSASEQINLKQLLKKIYL